MLEVFALLTMILLTCGEQKKNKPIAVVAAGLLLALLFVDVVLQGSVIRAASQVAPTAELVLKGACFDKLQAEANRDALVALKDDCAGIVGLGVLELVLALMAGMGDGVVVVTEACNMGQVGPHGKVEEWTGLKFGECGQQALLKGLFLHQPLWFQPVPLNVRRLWRLRRVGPQLRRIPVL